MNVRRRGTARRGNGTNTTRRPAGGADAFFRIEQPCTSTIAAPGRTRPRG